MAEKKISVPDVLPVLPVRDTVLFPGAVLPLTVGRESSLALVNSLEGDEKLLAVVAQLDPRIEDPSAADLHKVGTVAKVHKTVKMPNGNVVIFLEGLQRVQVAELITLRPFMRARVEPHAGSRRSGAGWRRGSRYQPGGCRGAGEAAPHLLRSPGRCRHR